MRVAVTMREVRDAVTGTVRDAVDRDLVQWLERLDVQPVLVPNGLADSVAWLRGMDIDGLLLTGGNDLGTAPARDATERALLASAVRDALPMFGICRGMQMLATFCGATGVERITPAQSHVCVQHDVQWRDTVCVTNSFHHFGLREASIPSTLEVLAMTPDGWVEAVRHRELPMWAVMWHPERAGSCTEIDNMLVGTWLDACAARRATIEV